MILAFRVWPIQDRDLANHLNQFRTGFLNHVINDRTSFLAIIAAHLHLDELVVVEGDTDLGEHGVTQSALAEQYHGL